jgi:hypothetical protein
LGACAITRHFDSRFSVGVQILSCFIIRGHHLPVVDVCPTGNFLS